MVDAPGPERLLGQLKLERSGVPIYVQLRDQVLDAIRTGLVAPGERLPTMRQVAVALKIDLNTVRHAYDELERLGALMLERGRGSFVLPVIPGAPGGDSGAARSLAANVLAQARAMGVRPAELVVTLRRLIEEEGSRS
jgi:GntR family transcriptional regulator